MVAPAADPPRAPFCVGDRARAPIRLGRVAPGRPHADFSRIGPRPPDGGAGPRLGGRAPTTPWRCSRRSRAATPASDRRPSCSDPFFRTPLASNPRWRALAQALNAELAANQVAAALIDSRPLRLPRDVSDPCRTGSAGVASAFVPAAQTRPPTLVYIARSTTICAGVAPRLSISVPKRAFATVGAEIAADRHVGAAVGRRCRCAVASPPPSSSTVTRPRPATRTCWRSGCRSARRRAADFTFGQRPARARRRRARRVVRLRPGPWPRPPHRALDDHRHVVHRRQLHRHRRRASSGWPSNSSASTQIVRRVGLDLVGLRSACCRRRSM